MPQPVEAAGNYKWEKVTKKANKVVSEFRRPVELVEDGDESTPVA